MQNIANGPIPELNTTFSKHFKEFLGLCLAAEPEKVTKHKQNKTKQNKTKQNKTKQNKKLKLKQKTKTKN